MSPDVPSGPFVKVVSRSMLGDVSKLAEEPDLGAGFVYAIKGQDNAIKIGWTLAVEKRLVTLQTGNPQELSVLASIHAYQDVEHHLHRRLVQERVRGEWFDGPQVRALVAEMRKYAANCEARCLRRGVKMRPLTTRFKKSRPEHPPCHFRQDVPAPVMDPAEAQKMRERYRTHVPSVYKPTRIYRIPESRYLGICRGFGVWCM